jgi:transcriptional regulator with XRE-family HTH domain
VITIGREPDTALRIRQSQGRKIRRLRKLRDKTATELAAEVGVSAGAISQWETGRVTPRQQHQLAIAKALDVEWSTIFDLDSEVRG